MNLYQRSIEIILQNQHEGGAFIASPNFPTYAYCWFRDGAFIAYSMDLAGHHESARRFHQWAANAINRREDVIKRALIKKKQGLMIGKEDILHTRYTLAGEDAVKEEWPNFQLDGFGTWLWSLRQHQLLTASSLAPDWIHAAGLVANYIASLWFMPCYDCWEESPEKVHPYTLAAIYGGLRSVDEFLLGIHQATSAEIRSFIYTMCLADQHFVKSVGETCVDASLIGLAVPYGVAALDDARMHTTVAKIESELRLRNGGVHRYARDTYYGGGEWVLLAAWLGWYFSAQNETGKAAELLRWVEAQADGSGQLPEQVPASLNDPAFHEPWIKRWGQSASPLLWSHAMHIILTKQME